MDDYPYLQFQLDAGLPLVLEPRCYTLSSTLVLRPRYYRNIRFIGTGATGYQGSGTYFQLTPNFQGYAALFVDGDPDLEVASNGNFEIGGFGIIAQGSPAAVGIQFGSAGRPLAGMQKNWVYNTHITGFPINYLIQDGRQISFERCSSWSPSVPNGAGFLIQTTSPTSFVGDISFRCCQSIGPDTSGKAFALRSAFPGAQIKGVHLSDVTLYGGARMAEMVAMNGGIIGDIGLDKLCQLDGRFGARDLLWIEGIGAGSFIDDINTDGVYFRGTGQYHAPIIAKSDGLATVKRLFMNNMWLANCLDRAAVFENVTALQFNGNILSEVNRIASDAVLLNNVKRFSACSNILEKDGTASVDWMFAVAAGTDYGSIVNNTSRGVANLGCIQNLGGGQNLIMSPNIG